MKNLLRVKLLKELLPLTLQIGGLVVRLFVWMLGQQFDLGLFYYSELNNPSKPMVKAFHCQHKYKVNLL